MYFLQHRKYSPEASGDTLVLMWPCWLQTRLMAAHERLGSVISGGSGFSVGEGSKVRGVVKSISSARGQRLSVAARPQTHRTTYESRACSTFAARSEMTITSFRRARVMPTKSLRKFFSSSSAKSISVKITAGADWPLKR